ncbi:DegV family protein [Fundicoccus culcitae]|uniref:DegV family protein n=1 Tax=Fundicoccus culcitae TaxID=2969821 RepID=A0ABY5P7F4_9LACT|nr:DegV family protein [Fundicoccus culcitae]UUX34305.1 DegV family protein [Fundicoccus culcitae]
MKWKIVTDSGSDIRHIDNLNEDVSFEVVPLMINIANEIYIDDENIDLEALLTASETEKKASSSACPAPNAYASTFEGAENVICFTLSSNLSGSYNSASLGREILLESHPEANVFIFDTFTAGSEMNLLVRKAVELANQGLEFNALVEQVKAYHEKTNVNFVLESVDNLVKNGRVSKIVGQMIGLLDIRLIGKRSDDGLIELAHKSRGLKRALNTLLQAMKDNNYQGGKVEISYNTSIDVAHTLVDKIKSEFPSANINLIKMSGLCTYYAQRNGMIVGFEHA